MKEIIYDSKYSDVKMYKEKEKKNKRKTENVAYSDIC